MRSTPEVESPKGLVFVVDDDDLVREAVASVLERRGFATEGCADAVQALSRLRAGLIPDVILLDLRMPGIDGWEFRVIQKEHRQWAEIPVIALSGDKSPKAAAIDAEVFLPKPIHERELMKSVERLFEVSQRRRRLDQDEELERLRDLGNLASGIAEQVSGPVASLAESLKLAQRQTAELEKRLASTDAFSLIGIRQLLQTAERGAERVQAVLCGIATFSEMALHSTRSRRRVLIAHSERRLVRLLHEALHEDYDLVTVASGMEAQLALVDGGFDAFLCELALPDMHGIDLFERLLEDKPEQACRTVFVISGSSFGERERAFFAHHRPSQLRAPFKASDLRELIEAQWRALH